MREGMHGKERSSAFLYRCSEVYPHTPQLLASGRTSRVSQSVTRVINS